MDDNFDGLQGDNTGAAPAGPADGQPQDGNSDGSQAPASRAQGPQVPEGFIPKYRYDEVAEQVRSLRGELARVQQAQSRPPRPQPGQAPTFDPETEAMREQLYGKVTPELKRWSQMLMENPEILDKLMELVQMGPQFQQEIGNRYEAMGATALRQVAAEGKKVFGADLNDDQRQYHEDAFIAFLDRSPARQQRYMRGDIESLVTEYWQTYNTHMVDPIRRRTVVTTQQRGERVARVPSAGPANQALGRGGAKPKTEDDLHALAADAAFQPRQ